MRSFSLLVLLMAIALVLGEENFEKKQEENEDGGEDGGEGELPKQERGKSNALTYLILERKAVVTYTNQNTAAKKNVSYTKKSNI